MNQQSIMIISATTTHILYHLLYLHSGDIGFISNGSIIIIIITHRRSFIRFVSTLPIIKFNAEYEYTNSSVLTYGGIVIVIDDKWQQIWSDCVTLSYTHLIDESLVIVDVTVSHSIRTSPSTPRCSDAAQYWVNFNDVNRCVTSSTDNFDKGFVCE
jgi:hypothetical protein